MSAVATSPTIFPFLWFDKNAEEAVDFYLSVFPNSSRLEELRAAADTPAAPAGAILTISFQIGGLRFVALNGGPHHKFTDAISLVVQCDTQQEIDDYWARLTDGGEEIACGWLHDKFGVAWQVTPKNMVDLIRHPQSFQAMMTMKKIDIAALETAAQS